MRPNFLFIMTDTQSADFIGCYGRPELQTPHLDRLARQGIRFDRAYTTCPVCSPARSAIFSGLMPSKAGAMTNNLALFQDVYHMGQYFTQMQYHTAYVGKWHLDGHDYFGDGICPTGWDERYWYDGKCYLDDLEAQSIQDERDWVELWRRGADTPEKLKSQGITAAFTWGHRISNRVLNLMANRSTDQPFLVVASYDEPHHPETCPWEYADQFKDYEYDLGPSAFDDLKDKPIHHQQWAQTRSSHTNENGKVKNPMFFGCNSFVDSEIGRVIEAAKKIPNTWIIFTSDHGDMMGAHGIDSKGPAMYEQITRVPLIVRPPAGISGRVDQTLISHIDLLPTMLHLAQQTPPAILDGLSFIDRLEQIEKPTQDRAIVMEFYRHSLSHDSYGGFIPIRCIVRDQWKLVINLISSDELYDLQSDPGEVTNQIQNSDLHEIKDMLLDELLDRMNTMRDPMRGPCWEQRPWRSKRILRFQGEYRMKPDNGHSPIPRVYATGRPVENRKLKELTCDR